MANSSWLTVTNEVLRLSLLPTIAQASDFDNDNLQEFQSAAKWFVRLAHKHLSLRCIKHFDKRRFQLQLFPGQELYPLDLGINGSCITFRSMFNITPGGTQNQEITAMKYLDFMTMNPDPSIIQNTPAAPKNWILWPIDRTDPNATQNVRIFPCPDQQYNLEYRARLLPNALNVNTDQVLFPPEYEHILWTFSWGQIERAMGEGKEGMIDQLAREASQSVELSAGLPDDIRPAVQTMRPARNYKWPQGKYTGWISSPPG